LTPHGWGIETLVINRDFLQDGHFGLVDARGVFPDGTPFSLPEDVAPPIRIPGSTPGGATIYAALPVRQPHVKEIATDEQPGQVTRFLARDAEIIDNVSGRDSVGLDPRGKIQVAALRIRFLIDGQDKSGYSLLPVARVADVRAERQIVLDEAFIAPCLNCAAQSPLLSFVSEISGRVNQRAEAVAARVAGPGSGGLAEVAELLTLQLLNRAQPLLAAIEADSSAQHPQFLYHTFLQLAGELATFATEARRAPAFAAYRHDDLQSCFRPLVETLREELSKILPPTAISIPLERRKGVFVALVPDQTLFKTATFIAAARAPMPLATLANLFPAQVKFAPGEHIATVVHSALAGVPLRPLQVAPRQLPFVRNTLYYELDRNNPFWKQLERRGGSSGLAIHVGAALQELEFELWAVNG
jgi:type VI secretion system protein ImpJ